MNGEQENSYASDLMAGGVGLFLGVLIGMAWKGLPACPPGAAAAAACLLICCFVACHYADNPVERFTQRLFQLVIGVGQGLLVMSVLIHT